jgi:hypothetical protein
LRHPLSREAEPNKPPLVSPGQAEAPRRADVLGFPPWHPTLSTHRPPDLRPFRWSVDLHLY